MNGQMWDVEMPARADEGIGSYDENMRLSDRIMGISLFGNTRERRGWVIPPYAKFRFHA